MGEAFICRRGAAQKDPAPVDLTSVYAELDWGRNPDGDFYFYAAEAGSTTHVSGYQGAYETLGYIDITRGVEPACKGTVEWRENMWVLYLTLL